jgi:hypothetical protein
MCLDVFQVLEVLILIDVENSLIIERRKLAIIEDIEGKLSGESTLLMLSRASHDVEEHGVVGKRYGAHNNTESSDAGLVGVWLALDVFHELTRLHFSFTFFAHFFFEVLDLLHKER